MLNLDRKLIGIRIMQKRKEHGFSQETLAEKIGISKNHLSNIERGNNTPTVNFIFDICRILGETPDYYLLGVISDETTEIQRQIRRLPEDKQHILLKLINTYLDCASDIDEA